MSVLRWSGPVLLALGIALVLAAVVTGAAHLLVVVVVPVFVGGASLLFFGGIIALFLGIFLLPLAFASELEEPGSVPAPDSPPPSGGSGGVILIGPIPVFFGGWKHPGRRTYWTAALVGALVLLLLFAVAWWVS